MARKNKPRRWERSGPSGFVAVDKPQGWTSHDVVDAARRWFGTRQVGHLGTLDPLATGVLPLAVRSATKLVPFLEGGEKAYVGTIRLGETTDTLDAEGEVLCRHEGSLPDEAAVRDALEHFLGEIEQVPPMYSAVKQDGVPLHKLARQGREVERPPKRVRIDRLELRSFSVPDIEFEVACSAGTYVRVIASDLGARLGCGGYLKNLCRTRSGPFTLEDAVTDKELAAAAERGEVDRFVIPPVEVLGFPVVQLDESDVTTVRHGGEIASLGPPRRPGSCIAAVEPGGRLLAVMEVRPGRRLHPVRVLPPLAPQG
jgi:tRNA pseudouridine55 synthase